MPTILLKAEELFRIGGMGITNSLFLSLFVLLGLAALGFFASRRFKIMPGRMQNLFELLIEKLLSLMYSVLGSREKSEKYLPLIATIFIFILTSNWLGLLPGVGSFVIRRGHENIPLLRSPASDLNFTLALAVLSVVCTNFFGVVVVGFARHFKKFFSVKGPIDFFVGILEILSEISKIVSFSFRLFGNVFAGEVLLTVMFFLLPYVVPVPFLMMELFFGMIQALIFAMLTLVFLSAHTQSVHE